MHHPTDRIAHTTAFVTPVLEHWLEREIAQWVHPMKDRSDDPLHYERMLLLRRYISLPLTTELHLAPSYHGATSRSLLPRSYISLPLTKELHLAPSYHRATSRSLLPRSYISLPLTMELHLAPSYHGATSRSLLPQSYISLPLTMELHLAPKVYESSQVCLMYTFRASCYSTRLSWAHTPVICWIVRLGQ